MKRDSLPSWEDCKKACDLKTADPIEQFIYDNEPSEYSNAWRKSFQDALYFFCGCK